MRSARRFLLILVISILGLIGTQFWYSKSKISFASKSEPIAYVRGKKNDAQQKPGERLIWKDVEQGQVLYRGDAVRTATDSQCDIVFTKSGSAILVEEDSYIVLEEMKGETSLHLMTGSLVAKGNGSAPVVRVGDYALKLDKEKSELAVSAHKGDVSGCVLSGGLSLEDGSAKRRNLDSGQCNRSNITAVAYPGSRALISRVNSQATTQIRFTGEVGKNQVALNVGRQRNSMRTLATTKDQGRDGRIEAVFPEGVSYWELVTTSGGKEIARSLVSRIEVVTLTAPTPLVPNDNSIIKTDQDRISVNLSWSGSKLAKRFVLEVANDPTFTGKLVLSTPLNESDRSVQLETKHTYFWRVRALWDDPTLPPLYSTPRRLSVAAIEKLSVPTLLFPTEAKQVSMDTLRHSGLVFKWSDVPDAELYSLRITDASKKTLNFESRGSSLKVDHLPPGKLEWSVQAQNTLTKSIWASPMTLEIIDTIDLSWLSPKDHTIESLQPKTTVDLSWSMAPGATRWKISYMNAEKNLKGDLEAAATHFRMALPAGVWRFRVDAYNAKGFLVGRTDDFPLSIFYVPLLDPPNLLDLPPPQKKLVAKGLSLRWRAVQGAASYVLSLSRKDQFLGHYETTQTQYDISNLAPARYRLQVRTKDHKGRVGKTRDYSILLSQESEVPPPKLQQLRIK